MIALVESSSVKAESLVEHALRETKYRTSEYVRGRSEIWMVKEVKELCSKLKIESFMRVLTCMRNAAAEHYTFRLMEWK